MQKERSRIFELRAARHIALVQKYLGLLVGYRGLTLDELKRRGDEHDLSKYSEAEREGYTLLTWRYHCRAKGISLLEEPHADAQITAALKHHHLANRHHPEAHRSPADMTLLDLVEMVCDWAAIAEENSGELLECRQWALANIDRKWSFPKETRREVFLVIDELERRCSAIASSKISNNRSLVAPDK